MNTYNIAVFITDQCQEVSNYLNLREKSWRQQQGNDLPLINIAALLLSIALVLFIFKGEQAGFFISQRMAHSLLSESTWAQLTFCGDTLTALTIALLFSYRYPQLVLAILMAAFAGTLLIHGFKHGFHIPRPPAALPHEVFTIIGPAYKSNSLPSGHSATAFILAGVLTRCCTNRSTQLLLLAAAALVAFSRVACGVHWPIDVLCGAAIGLVAAQYGLKVSTRKTLKSQHYMLICLVQIGCALALFNYDAGFDVTLYLAQTLSCCALLLWLGCWVIHFTYRYFLVTADFQILSDLKTKNSFRYTALL